VESYAYQVKESQRYINPNAGRFFVQRAHLNYYAGAYNRGRTITPQDKIESNKTKASMRPYGN